MTPPEATALAAELRSQGLDAYALGSIVFVVAVATVAPDLTAVWGPRWDAPSDPWASWEGIPGDD